jgi:cobalt-zinc-cadmium efflux system outer membrane protein
MKSSLKQLITSWICVLALANLTVVAQQIQNETSAEGSGNPKVPGNQPQERVSLQELIKQGLSRNPEIKAMERSIDMMRARIPQARALPEPMLSVGYMGNIVPIPPFDIQKDDPSSGRSLSLSQEIPLWGKRALKGKIASMDAESEWWTYEQTRLNVVGEIKDAYFELFYLDKAISIIKQNKDLLGKFARIAEARYAVGKGIQQDVLKAQVEISKLIEQLTLLEQRRELSAGRINSLLYRDVESPVARTEEINAQPFSFSLGEIKEMALASFPSLKAQKQRISRQQYALELADKEFYPDISVTFNYQNRPAMPDMYGLMIGVKLPIFPGQRQRPALTEAASAKAMEEKRLQSIITLLSYKVQEKYLAAKTAERLVSLYKTTLIPQSSLSLESAIAGYEVGSIDFLTLLDNLVTLLNYELNYYEQVSNREKALAALEPLVGITLRP